MIAPEIARLITSPTMIIVATADRNNKASIGRVTGALFDRVSTQVSLLVSARQWSHVFVDLEPGSPIAATFVVPKSYQTVQIKGRVEAILPATPQDNATALAYRASMQEVMADTGVSIAQLSHTMALEDLRRISFLPTDVFNQTPGPQAGTRLRKGTLL